MKKILIAGAGGQGIVSLGKIIAYSAMNEGLNVSCIPSYGPEMRGGTANCFVVYDNQEIKSPVFDNANILVAMNQCSLDKYQSRVFPEGYIIMDSNIDFIDDSSQQKQIMRLPVSDTAKKAGDSKSQNMVILGVLSKLFKDFSLNDVIDSVKKLFKEKQEVIATSIKALRLGFKLV
jgi:2-oxoglutarate ferredoxin oxidoreductase subunit gamma